MDLVDGYMLAVVCNTGYGANTANKNWEFEEYDSVETTQNPYVSGENYLDVCYLDQNSVFVNAGLEYIEQTQLIGKTTDVDGTPDSNFVDIGFHHPNWDFVNADSYYAGDLDENLIVDFRDFAILANSWQQTYDITDLSQMCGNWLMTGKADPNIVPFISGDPNCGYVGISASEFPPDTKQVVVFDNGKHIGTLYGFDYETLALDVSESGNQEHHIKLISITNSGQITCSHITNTTFSCPLTYCILPGGYESGESLGFSAFNPGAGNVSVELLADGGISVWSQTYSGNSFSVAIPANITSQHYLDRIILSAGPGISPIIKPIYPRVKEKKINPETEALIIEPVLSLSLVGCEMLDQVERAFIQNGIKYARLGWTYATSKLVAAHGWACPIRYLYVLSHGGYQYNKNGGVLRTRVLLADGLAVSVKRNDFAPYQWPSWCKELELDLEYSPVWSWASMGFDSLEFAYFNCCYAGRLKINASDQLVQGQQGQIGVFDGPHSDMSYALGMASTNRDCVYQGWYDKAWFTLDQSSPFSEWTVDEWNNLALGLPAGSLYTAIQYAISRQTSFMDPNAPVNTYRLKGHGLLTEIGLHD